MKMPMADTVMDADEPRFQIGENEMDDRQIVLGNLWVAALGNGKVFIPALAEAGISTPIAGDVSAPTFGELYSGKWEHPTCCG